MTPKKMEVVGEFLAILWDDGSEGFIPLEQMRRACRCARCAGEVDVTGQVRTMGPPPVLNDSSYQIRQWETVGNYAISVQWGDGHDTGIYSYKLLKELGEQGA